MKRQIIAFTISALVAGAAFAQTKTLFMPEATALPTVAENTPLTNGYRVVNNPFLAAQQRTANQPVDVVEYFSYGCPHCADLSPKLAQWEAKQGAGVRVIRFPVGFGRGAWVNLGKMYLALRDMEAMTPELDAAIFKAIHQEGVNLANVTTMKTWLADRKIDLAKFEAAYANKNMEARLQAAETAVRNMRFDGVPAIVVGGQFAVPADEPGKQIEAVNKAVTKVRGGK